jgi:hypothetical protein
VYSAAGYGGDTSRRLIRSNVRLTARDDGAGARQQDIDKLEHMF